MIKTNKYVIFDRDGTLIQKVHYLSSIDQVRLVENVVLALKILKIKNFNFGIITNQSAISRKFTTLQNVQFINDTISKLFQKEGINFDFVYLCPHIPEDLCRCRKPETQLGEMAITKFKIDVSSSYFIGDQETDLEFARKLGLKAIGIHNQSLKQILCDKFAEDMLSAALWIIKDSE